MGEHDITTDEDTVHIDVPVARQKPHPKFDADVELINDIGIIFMAYEVQFTSELNFIRRKEFIIHKLI